MPRTVDLQKAVKFLNAYSLDGLNLAGDIMRRMGIELPFYEPLVERWHALQKKKMDRDISAHVRALRDGCSECLRTLAEEPSDPWSQAASRAEGDAAQALDGVAGRFRQGVGLIRGALVADEPHPEVSKLVVKALWELLEEGGVRDRDHLDASVHTRTDEIVAALESTREAFSKGDTTAAREALEVIQPTPAADEGPTEAAS